MSAKFKGRARLNTDLLKKLQEELKKAGGSRVNVGVLAGRAARPATGTYSEEGYKEGEQALNNAEIGAVHEFGSKSSKIPERSFLRVPVVNELPKEVAKIKAVKFVKVILEQGMKTALQNLGVIGEQVVDKAFETRGYGKWEPNAPFTIAKKGSDQPLIDHAFLRKSITSAVVMKGEK